MISLRPLICVRSLNGRAIKRLQVTTTKPKFPYGVSSFKQIIQDNLFYADKTSYIRQLEMSGKFLKIYRPRRFGKTLFCDMLGEFYDAANRKEKIYALFKETDIMKEDSINGNMGKFLILNFCFSKVSPDGDVEANFRSHINNTVYAFCQKYCNAGLLKRSVKIDHSDALSSLERLFSLVELSNQKVYLIVDECDSFTNRLLLSVDTTKPDLGLSQYEEIVAGRESMLRNWAHVIKAGTTRTIERAFFTGVVPPALADGGLSSMNMVKDITFHPRFAGLFGLTSEDVSKGLRKIDLTHEQRVTFQDHIQELYEGYRFAKDQKTQTMYNPQYVLYYLRHLDRKGVPPESIIDRVVCNSIDNVAQYLITSHKTAGADYTLQYFALGTINPEESGTFAQDAVPSFRSVALFQENAVSNSLVSLAFFHGFLTYKSDKQCRAVLTSPNKVVRMLFAEALFAGLPGHFQEQLLAEVRSNQPDPQTIKNILIQVRDSAANSSGLTAAGGEMGVKAGAAAARLLVQLLGV